MYKKMNLKIIQAEQANFLNCESIIYITEDFQPQRIKVKTVMAGEVLIILVR